MGTIKGQWTQQRRNCWTLKIVVACCIALVFLSPAFSRKLPADSKTYLGRSVLIERRVERRSEVRGRILEEEDGDPGDLMNDYSTPTHNQHGSSPPVSKATVRGTMRYSQNNIPAEFARYTAAYGHRHLRGV